MDLYLGLILILAWMYSTTELNELFQILNSVKGFKLKNHSGATQQNYFLQIERSVFITTGIFTRVDYLRINKKIRLTIKISGFHEFHGFSYQHNSL